MKKRLAKKMKKRQTECVQTQLDADQIEKVCVQKTEKSVQAVKKNVQVTKEPVMDEQLMNQEPESAAVDSLQDKGLSTGKSGQKVNIFCQFSQHQVERQEIINRIKNQWKSQGNMLKDLKDLVIYLKVEDNKAYYVINETEQGWITAWE
ncbi:DUF6465 family protein [Catenibacillus scindens]|uniref:DUF6465 family protein n=1 Tax=Catenibacillus scindens TaxID=673271 RepID=UPI003209B2EA